MPEFRLSPEAERDLDNIWLYIARSSGSLEIANQVTDRITEHFWLLARHPYIGRRRDRDLRPGLRSFPADEYVILYRVDDGEVVLVLHIFHGRQDIEALTGE